MSAKALAKVEEICCNALEALYLGSSRYDKRLYLNFKLIRRIRGTRMLFTKLNTKEILYV